MVMLLQGIYNLVHYRIVTKVGNWKEKQNTIGLHGLWRGKLRKENLIGITCHRDAETEQDRDNKPQMLLKLLGSWTGFSECCCMMYTYLHNLCRPQANGCKQTVSIHLGILKAFRTMPYRAAQKITAWTCLNLTTCDFGWKISRTINRLLAFIPYYI